MSARTIWKYLFNVTDALQSHEMPRGAKIVCVAEQCGYPCLWAEGDPSLPSERRTFRVYGTGFAITEGIHVGTCFIGGFVWHLYEIKSRTGVTDD